MNLGEEDLGVLMKVLVENIGEGSEESENFDAGRSPAPGGKLWLL